MVKGFLNISLATEMLKKIRPLCIFLPEMSTYRRDFVKKSFLIKDDELLEKHIKICKKLKISIKKDFDSETVNNEKYLKAQNGIL